MNDDYSIPKKVLQIKQSLRETFQISFDAECSRMERRLKRSLDAKELNDALLESQIYAMAVVMALELENVKNQLREEFLAVEERREFNPNVQKMHIKKTQRGFDLIEFVDHYGAACSLQKSSLATEDCIWLGTNTNRMHLTQEQVSQLLPHLQEFVENGELGGAPFDENPDFFEDEKRKFEEGIE